MDYKGKRTFILTGNTFPHKKELEAAGGHWDPPANGWEISLPSNSPIFKLKDKGVKFMTWNKSEKLKEAFAELQENKNPYGFTEAIKSLLSEEGRNIVLEKKKDVLADLNLTEKDMKDSEDESEDEDDEECDDDDMKDKD